MSSPDSRRIFRVSLQARRGPLILVEVRYQLKKAGAHLVSIKAQNAGLSGDELLLDFALPTDRHLTRTLRSIEGVSGVAITSAVEVFRRSHGSPVSLVTPTLEESNSHLIGSAMTLKLRMITPDKRGIGRRIKDAVQAAGGKVLSLGNVREMRGMSETEARLTAPNAELLQEAVAALGRIPGIAILNVRLEGALSEHAPSIRVGPSDIVGLSPLREA